jgi:hypothetical protein
MDFTPVNFSGIPGITRRTTGGFEIALSVIFTSGIQHIAETPSGMAAQKDFVKEYMSTLPESWDDVKFIDGFPGIYAVLARKKGDRWYVAGINGENNRRTITFNVPFLSDTNEGIIITDSVSTKYFIKRGINLSSPLNVTMYPYGGFVIKTLLAGEEPDTNRYVTAVDKTEMTGNFYLGQNYPNPFNPTTVINYQLPVTSNISLAVYNLLGQEVATLFEGFRQPGNYEATFSAGGGSASGGDGSKLASGVYLYRLSANHIGGSNFVDVKKLILLK